MALGIVFTYLTTLTYHRPVVSRIVTLQLHKAVEIDKTKIWELREYSSRQSSVVDIRKSWLASVGCVVDVVIFEGHGYLST